MIFRFFKILVPAVLLLFLFSNILKDWKSVYTNLSNLNTVFIFISVPFFLIIYPQGAYCWYLITKKLKFKISLDKAITIWLISNTSRYIPGIIWQYLGRVILAQKIANLNKKQVILSSILEIIFTITASIFVGLIGLSQIDISEISTFFNLWYLFIFIPLILFHPLIRNKIIEILGKHTNYDLPSTKLFFELKDSIFIIPHFMINFLLNGIAIYLIIRSFGVELPVWQTLLISGMYSISWLFGYLSFFSPGGIGVTEVSLAYFLSYLIPFPQASLVSLMYRLFLTVSEIVVFTASLKILKYEKN